MKFLKILTLTIICYLHIGNSFAYDFKVDGIYYNKISNNEVEVTFKSTSDRGYSGEITIPNSVQYGGNTYNVTSIGESAFYNCSGLTGSLTIPYSVTYIGSYAFYRCSGFSGSLTIPNSVTFIGEAAFNQCSGFSGSLTIPNSVTSIGEAAFTNCTGLTGSLTISNSITSIKKMCFKACNFTGPLTIPSSVTMIEEEAFNGCHGLTGSLIIPSSMTSIGRGAFQDCMGLTGLTIPNSVISIESEAFLNCRSIDVVKSEIENPFSIDTYVFWLNNSKHKTLQVPKGTKSKYAAFIGWTKYFNEIIEYEVTTITTYSLSIFASGNGSASYNGTSIRNKTSTFTVNEGTSVSITIMPDNGYRIKSVKENDTNTTSYVSNGTYTINSISRNTNVEVEFEVMPTTTYTLSIKATGNGCATYNGTLVKNGTTTFSVNSGSNATITFSPDGGYRIKSVNVDNIDVTSNVSNNQYTISNITANTTMDVEFEEIPATTWTLSVFVSGNGVATYNNTSVRGKTEDFTVVDGSMATIKFIPDNGYRIKTVKLNSADVTGSVVNSQYTINRVMANTSLEVEFMEDVTGVSKDGLNFVVVSYDDGTVCLSGGSYGSVLTVPTSFTENNKEWKVIGVDESALSDNAELAAIIWNPEAVFNGSVSNPNLLLYVKSKEFAPADVQNVIVDNMAESIVLTDAESRNTFYCPRAFTASRIIYEHNYSMKSGYKSCQGWETLVLPFDVTQVLRQGETELVPYDAWTKGSVQRPFWLYSLTELGWKAETSIAANTPYLIGMPNNEKYDPSYNVTGKIQFIGVNVQVKTSDNLTAGKKGQKKLVPNYQNQDKNSNFWTLNVNNDISTNTESSLVEGSAFVQNMRPVHPFEAYLTVTGPAASRRVIPIFDDNETTGIINIPLQQDINNYAWYTLEGRKLQSEPTSKGVYIKNGKKVVVK